MPAGIIALTAVLCAVPYMLWLAWAAGSPAKPDPRDVRADAEVEQ